ncbi:MAG: hypothetical protein ACE5OQ_03130 [Woeseia sp.]
MKVATTVITIAAIAAIGQPVIAAETGTGDEAVHQRASATTGKMHERMQSMHEQMEKIHATEDAEERHRLMQEHMRDMCDSMMMMGKMDQPMMRHGTEEGAGSAHHAAPINQQHHMEKPTEKMQMMMEHDAAGDIQKAQRD